ARLGQLEAVRLVVAPAAQEDGAVLLGLDLHAEDVDEEAQRLLALRRQQLHRSEVRDVGHTRAAPSTSALSFAHATCGWVRPPKPQSQPAITFSRPSTSTSRRSRSATRSGCSTTSVACVTTPGTRIF